ncbi:MAG: hypothetical protein HKL98_00160 [Burkholderiales bacterium]|nr:hypothetical protein [Burkholderiales bacterium]
MKLFPAIFAALLLATPAFAAAPKEAPPQKQLTKQQMRMKDCSREAKEKKLKREERRSFMKSCLSGKK